MNKLCLDYFFANLSLSQRVLRCKPQKQGNEKPGNQTLTRIDNASFFLMPKAVALADFGKRARIPRMQLEMEWEFAFLPQTHTWDRKSKK